MHNIWPNWNKTKRLVLTLVEGMLLLCLATLAAAEKAAVENAQVERAECI